MSCLVTDVENDIGLVLPVESQADLHTVCGPTVHRGCSGSYLGLAFNTAIQLLIYRSMVKDMQEPVQCSRYIFL